MKTGGKVRMAERRNGKVGGRACAHPPQESGPGAQCADGLLEKLGNFR